MERLEKTQAELAAELAKMSHYDLYKQRLLPGADQNYLAPFEHRAFTREAVENNPLMALPVAASIPIYEIAKLLHLQKGARSDPSIASYLQGSFGIGEGLYNAYQKNKNESP